MAISKEVVLPVVGDGSFFTAEVEVSSTFGYTIPRATILATIPTSVSIHSASVDIGTFYLNDNKWLITNLIPGDKITGQFTFILGDTSVLPISIKFELVDPPALDSNSLDNATIINVYGTTCGQIADTCFEGILPKMILTRTEIDGCVIMTKSFGSEDSLITKEAPGSYKIKLSNRCYLDSVVVVANSGHTSSNSFELEVDDTNHNGNQIYLHGNVVQSSSNSEVWKGGSAHIFQYDDSAEGKLKTKIYNLDYGVTGFKLLLTAATSIKA